MKKTTLFIFMTYIFLLNGCTKIDVADKKIFDENSITVGESNEMEDIVILTAEEEKLLCDYFINEEQIRMGKLHEHQKEYLKQLRFSRNYLENKYPDTEFYINWYNYPTKEDVVGVMSFQVDKNSDKFYELQLEISEMGTYDIMDNYYGSLIMSDYDEAVRNLIENEVGVYCITFTEFKFLKGSEIHGTLTAEEIFALGNELGRNTNIFLDSEMADVQDVLPKIKSVMYNNNLYGSYTLFIGKELLKNGKTGEQLKEYSLQKRGMGVEAYFFDCFDVGSNND